MSGVKVDQVKWRSNKVMNVGPNPTAVGVHLWDSLREGKQAFGISRVTTKLQCFSSQSNLFYKPLPSKLALLISLDHHLCNFAVAAAYQLSVPEKCFMSSKMSET